MILLSYIADNNYLRTKGNPNPALAQFTPANFSRSTSATGLTKFAGGNNAALHEGHVYPAGAVVEGNCLE